MTDDELRARREAEGRCTLDYCGRWLANCGHDRPLTERMRTVQIDRTSLKASDRY